MIDPEPPTDSRLAALGQQIVAMGLEGVPSDQLLQAFGEGMNAAGVPILRLQITLRALHPEFGAFLHMWRRSDGLQSTSFEHETEPSRDFVESPFYYLLESELTEYRQLLAEPSKPREFPVFQDFRELGGTDYIAFKTFFTKVEGSVSTDPDDPEVGCIFSVLSDAEDGLEEWHINGVREVLPLLLLAIKSNANRQMAEGVSSTYLGRDAGARVLSGDIQRGSVQGIDAVICYFDLSGFTKLSEALSGREVIDMLNAYFEVAVRVVQSHGGNVLKFMGDGMLAIFNVEKCIDANLSALDATADLRGAIDALNVARQREGLRTTGFTLALHRGEVLYGNIGGASRLDFTVIGPAVNTAARLSGMCAHVDQSIVISANVARPLLKTRSELVSLGQYRLRGVAERQELFTLDEPESP